MDSKRESGYNLMMMICVFKIHTCAFMYTQKFELSLLSLMLHTHKRLIERSFPPLNLRLSSSSPCFHPSLLQLSSSLINLFLLFLLILFLSLAPALHQALCVNDVLYKKKPPNKPDEEMQRKKLESKKSQ